MNFLRYSPDVETIGDDEPALFQKIADTFAEVGRSVAQNEGHASRVSHAKGTALLDGELTIVDGLATELAQGLAAAPGRYLAEVRFAQGPGENLHDRVSTHRGMAIKLQGLSGDTISQSGEPGTQDFVLEARSKAFINANATTFFANLRGGVSHAPSLPESVKNAVSAMSRAAEAGLEAIGLESKTVGFFGHPKVHPLSEAYYSQVPMRWGNYVAKVGMFPTQATLDNLAEINIDTSDDHDAFRTAMIDHFATHGAEFELRVQLATNLDDMPVEDASKEWSEKDSPYRTVARVTLAPQSAWSSAHEAESDRLSFRPANSLAAHRPLGQVMRARLFVYEKLVALRHSMNGEADAREASEALSV